jgi:hypothetical protein
MENIKIGGGALGREEGPQVPHTGPQELRAIRAAQEREYELWRGIEPYQDAKAIQEAVTSGELVPISDQPELGYKISANADMDLRYIRPGLVKLIKNLSVTWLKYMRRFGEPHENLFLILTSFVRTMSYQQRLIEAGYPAARDDRSTHLRGAAFDIGTKWLESHRPRAVEALRAALKELSERHEINIIYEEAVGAFHIAASPQEANQEELVARKDV